MRRLPVLAVLGFHATVLAIALVGCAAPSSSSPPPDRCQATGSSLQLLEPVCWVDAGPHPRVSADAGRP